MNCNATLEHTAPRVPEKDNCGLGTDVNWRAALQNREIPGGPEAQGSAQTAAKTQLAATCPPFTLPPIHPLKQVLLCPCRGRGQGCSRVSLAFSLRCFSSSAKRFFSQALNFFKVFMFLGFGFLLYFFVGKYQHFSWRTH